MYSNSKDTNIIEFDVWDKDVIGKDDYCKFYPFLNINNPPCYDPHPNLISSGLRLNRHW